MSPAITDGERFGGFHVCQIRLSDSASWSFCLIGVLIGVVRVIFCAPWYRCLSFFHTENKTSRALAGTTAITRATLGSCNECGARRALAYSAN